MGLAKNGTDVGTITYVIVPTELKGAQWFTDAPTRLKKELDAVLALQGDLDSVERAIHSAKLTLSRSSAPANSAKVLKGLQETHDELSDRVEDLYISLNIPDSFPNLQGVGLDFVRTLLMARDLKANIRKRAIGSFFEWDRLDQAVGGKSNPLGALICVYHLPSHRLSIFPYSESFLGTKLHQHTRKAISKRQPTLMKAIRKFNGYCERLEGLFEPSSNIPLPLPLPTKLADLRDNSSLMEDVWITPSTSKPPAWLEDPDVRVGIRALLKVERCLEEQKRLGIESDNLCRWFGRELGAVELSLLNPSSTLS
jgi:hypothetical protein